MKIILKLLINFTTKSLKNNKIFSLSSGIRKVLTFTFVLSIIITGLFSCKKTPSQIGAQLLPDSTMQVYFTDTLAVQTYSLPLDSVRSDEKGTFFVGSIKDPVFGTTNAGFYAQFQQSVTHDNFGTNPKLDSLVLQLLFSSNFGDTNAVLRMHVYELQQDIYLDSTYYSNKTVPVYPTDYANINFVANPHTKIVVGGKDTLTRVVRFNLSNLNTALGDKLLQTDTAALDSNAIFIKYFKGLYLKTDQVTSGGALPSFSSYTPSTALILYYHNDSTDSLHYTYYLNNTSATINQYQHVFSDGNSAFNKQIVQKDTLLGEVNYYTQGLAGVKTIIKFPDIKKLARLGLVGINEAKLILPGAEPQPLFGAPYKMSLIKILTDTSFQTLVDEAEGANYFGGAYKVSTNSYEFRITHYIQSLLKDTTKVQKGLILYIGNGVVNPKRFVFNGPKPVSDTLAKTKLEILYTKIN